MATVGVDLAEFKTAFPEWKDCADGQLSFWQDIAACMICLPDTCPALAKRLPMLMLAHVLTVNGVKCKADTTDSLSDACECDDEFLNHVLNSGARVSSVSIEGVSASFNNVGINQLVNTIGSSAFSAWLAMSTHGMMIAAILPRLYAGPTMAFSTPAGSSHFGDNLVLGHTTIPGHG